MVRRAFLAAILLINAPVYASEKDFPAFLKDYSVFKSQRDVQSQRHTARFRGEFVFREGCSFYSENQRGPARLLNQESSEGECECPTGNRYLQCLVSARAVITADRNDIGGKGYVQVLTEGSVLNQSGTWVPMTDAGVYTTTMNPVIATNIIDIPVPDAATRERLCMQGAAMPGPPGRRSSKPFVLTVGYGAVMPMDMEFARRMKIRSNELGQEFDEEAFTFSRARVNGIRPKKAGEIGSVECRPTDAYNG